FSHVSVMRKVLLRMTSWMHYLYFGSLRGGGRLWNFAPCKD
ncbi:hypothetical protein, partial [Shigella sp. FC1882]